MKEERGIGPRVPTQVRSGHPGGWLDHRPGERAEYTRVGPTLGFQILTGKMTPAGKGKDSTRVAKIPASSSVLFKICFVLLSCFM